MLLEGVSKQDSQRILIVIAALLFSVESFALEAGTPREAQAETILSELGSPGETQGSEPRSARFELYSETYASAFSTSPVNFQRATLNLIRLDKWGATSVFVAGERYADESSANISGELGLMKPLVANLSLVASVRREYLNDAEQTNWVARGGLVYGRFFDLPLRGTFADTYAELFYRAPFDQVAGQVGGLTLSGWAKYGYRLVSTDHFSLDPLMVMARAFDSSDRTYLGADYQSINVGPQLTYFLPSPNFSVNLILSRAFTHSFTAPDSIVNQTWFLFALGASF